MVFEWKISYISEKQQVWQNNLDKISFILVENTDKEYKSTVLVDLLWEKVDLINPYKVWTVVRASLNFRTSEYNWRYFNNISAWRIDSLDGSSPAPVNDTPKEETEDEDLPF